MATADIERAEFDSGEAQLSAMQAVARHHAKADDPYFLVRQLARFEKERDACRCSEHTCAGCVRLTWLIGQLDTLTEEIRRTDPSGCSREVLKAIGITPPEQQSLLTPPARLDEVPPPEDARHP